MANHPALTYRSIGAKRCLIRTSALLASAGIAMPALAQSVIRCKISLDYSAVATAAATPTAVPGMTLFSVGILAAVLGVLAWHKRPGAGKVLAAALWASAGLLTAQGSDGLVQSVRAASPYYFSATSGGTVSDTFQSPIYEAPAVTVTNTSGVRIKITGNTNKDESGSCTVGTEIAPNGSCTAAPACSILGISS